MTSSLTQDSISTLFDQLPEHALPYPFLRSLNRAKRLALLRSGLSVTPDSFLAQETENFLLAQPMSWDSAFFGSKMIKIDQLHALSAGAADRLVLQFEAHARQQKASYCLTMLPVENTIGLDALGRAGWSVIETRVTYARSALARYVPRKRYPVRLATPEDIKALGDVAAETINPYDRFHADPYFSEADAQRLMREWVRASISSGFADAVLTPATGNKGFLTFCYHQKNWPLLGENLAQLVLSAVHTEAHGWYPMLMSEGLMHLQEQGATSVVITTQAANRPVIRTWESLGFAFGSSTLVLRRRI